MATLKAYTFGNGLSVRTDIAEALGLKPHIRQADVIPVAASKAAAIRLMEEVGVRPPAASDPEFRVDDDSNTVTALREAGLLDAPAVYVTPGTSFGGTVYPVVQIVAGRPELIGVLRRTWSNTVFVREQMPVASLNPRETMPDANHHVSDRPAH